MNGVFDRRTRIGLGIALGIAGAVSALHWVGGLDRLEHAFAESRARVLAREVDSNIVVVGIDARSLQSLDEWPWPRRYHARLLQMLQPSSPARVFLDIDFSSRSNPEDDALFERALEAWDGPPVLLASHFQRLDESGRELTLTRPLARFAAHAREVSVVLQPDADGLVRTMQSSWSVAGVDLEAVFTADSHVPPATAVPIDFSISPSSFDYVSYSDLVNGRIHPADLHGREVYVGATAVELRDQVTVPVYRTLPGVVMQALATESVRAGVLRAPPAWLYFGLLALWAAGCTRLMDRSAWRSNAVKLAAAVAAPAAASLYLYAFRRIELDVVPFAAVGGAAFLAAVLRSLDAQSWRAIAYAVGLRRRDALLKSIVQASTDAIVCTDGRGAIRTANPAAGRLFGQPPHLLIGVPLARFVPDFAVEQSASRTEAPDGVTEHEAVAAGGRTFGVESTVSRVPIDDETLYTVVIRDVSERRAQRRQLEYQATHDALTGLPNRAALKDHLETVLEEARPGCHVALLMLDLARFKEVNDTLGHDVGDRVLAEVATRFAETVGERGFVARIGGDEFTVVLRRVGTRAAIDEIARELAASLQQSIYVRGVAMELGVSIGVALAPDHAGEPGELLRHADVAMYSAKRRGTLSEYYDRTHDRHTVRRLSMMSELRAAIGAGGIELHYQPQVELQTGRVVSVEALMRWRHPMLGDVSPAEFVTLAETTNMIRPLTEWSIEQALQQRREWKKQDVDLRVAVNLSARVLQDAAFPTQLRRILDEQEADRGSLELEITESAMLLDPRRAARSLNELHALGVLISIDDYGTGFSSLSYLRDLPVHGLKLDRSFVTDLDSAQHNRVIVESTADMARALDLQIVGEGVETDSVMHYLRAAGYDLAQGFLFASAMPAGPCGDWIIEFNSGRRWQLMDGPDEIERGQSRRLG